MKTRSNGETRGRPIEALLLRLQPEMARILKVQAIPPEDAEDLLQESVFALLHKWEGVRNPEAWLLATLRNRCTLYWRRRRDERFQPVDLLRLDALAGPQAPPQEREELRHDLNVALSHLTEEERNILRLRFEQGWESAEIAAELGFGSEGLRRLTSRSVVELGRAMRQVGFGRADRDA